MDNQSSLFKLALISVDGVTSVLHFNPLESMHHSLAQRHTALRSPAGAQLQLLVPPLSLHSQFKQMRGSKKAILCGAVG